MTLTAFYQTVVWNTADKFLRSIVEPEDYGDYILPLTVLRRLECILAPTKNDVLDLVSQLQSEGYSDAMIDWQVQQKFDLSFYNSSRLDLTRIAQLDDHVYESLMEYVGSFSSSIRDIWDAFDFDVRMKTLDSASRLWQAVKHFAGIDMSIEALPDTQMGDLFEHIMYKSFDTKGKAAGAFYTPRDAIRLMVDILFASDDVGLTEDGASRAVYDPTVGTGGMLTMADEKIREENPTAEVSLYGQEINPASYAICKADMVVKGQPIDNIVLGNTLTQPAFRGRTFHFALSNPPFGVDWKQSRKVVEEEHAVRGFDGRFGPGLPRVSDGSTLFLLHLISKLREPQPGDPNASAGRGAIVLNGSPLFTGGAGSGESNIRKWVLEQDYLEAIVALPTDMFYNTGIATYVWLLNKDKPRERRGKVQLIDATGMFEKMRKSIGSKRRQLSAAHIAEVTRLFDAFEESKHSKIFRIEDFLYRTITVERPLRLNYGFGPDRVERVLALRQMAKADGSLLEKFREGLTEAGEADAGALSTSRAEFSKRVSRIADAAGLKLTAAQLRAVLGALGEHDDEGELVVKAGRPEPSADLRDTENVPWDEDVEEYLEREVKPWVPDAWIDHSKTKEGAEIPFTRHFYEYVPPRPLEEIDAELDEVLGRIRARLEEVKK
ncbi:type I restriction-modification system subunit M [Helcobacillus sp. ACRRO]|uniref:type I restriction-modification system subunit M n=1 Tax=Helcobacillus sp. ACRRO TaxID=2918202 RepID=UPI001EF48291|nr:type I restriction-modification system subunit M [Helcobacillus sp. ACRRO]MCG7427434.1 type I restriction-modification system subunit M [Helcobacillus sp. ACRRO]